MDQTLFYVLGAALVVAAISLFAIGTRSERFPSDAMLRVGLLVFVVLVGGTTTFAVLNAKNEQKDRQAKLAREEQKLGSAPAPGGGTVPKPDAIEIGAGTPTSSTTAAAASGQPPPAAKQPKVKGPGGSLALSADPTQLAFDKASLASKPGKVTINLTNPAQISHDIGVKKGSQLLAVSPQVAQSKTSISVDLAPGTYEFLCTVPGHEQAGMKGTLTVK